MNIKLDELIYPVFVKRGEGLREEIPLMPGSFRLSPDVLLKEVKDLVDLELKSFLIFGVPDEKTWHGTTAYNRNGIVTEAVKLLKSKLPDITIFTDVCLCAYTSHGHCGIVKKGEEKIDLKETLIALSEMALAHAEAGADYVAPSAMAKGQVDAIRKALDVCGYKNTKIMAYSAKFASNAYGPFRNVADSAPRFGDRRGYQLDYSQKEEALKRIEKDITEGADIVMIKPAMWYLDMVNEVKNKIKHPLAVYNVSGEYAVVKEGAKLGLWEEKKIVNELLSSMKRSGADLIITYHAKDIARWLK
ncbi:MAG: porphobilinogen synthase [Candidatus Omnitrophota bacterium]